MGAAAVDDRGGGSGDGLSNNVVCDGDGACIGGGDVVHGMNNNVVDVAGD